MRRTVAARAARRVVRVTSGPWTVEVTRGDLVESVHAVSVVLLDGDGAPVVRAGDVEEPILGRSALKPAQAVAVLEAGAELTDAEVAMAAGSHSGESVHVDAVRALLARQGLDESALGCPPDLPLGVEASRAWLAAGGVPSRVAMNCSGKHAAMLAACVARSWPFRATAGGAAAYLDPAHAMQDGVRAALERLAGPVVGVTVDGCGAPAFATDLTALARLFGRLAQAERSTPEHRVADAMRARPDLVAGTARLDTVTMTEITGALSKIGAEGVLAAALPDGSSLAVKVHDGAGRAVGPVLLELLHRADLEIPSGLRAMARPSVIGGGHPVGDHRVRA